MLSTDRLDLALDDSGDLDVGADLSFTVGIDAVRQAILIRLQHFRGEWFLDEETGVPYYETILVKNPNLIEVREAIRNAILSAPGVGEIEKFVLDYDSLRKLNVTWAVRTTFDDTIEETTVL